MTRAEHPLRLNRSVLVLMLSVCIECIECSSGSATPAHNAAGSPTAGSAGIGGASAGSAGIAGFGGSGTLGGGATGAGASAGSGPAGGNAGGGGTSGIAGTSSNDAAGSAGSDDSPALGFSYFLGADVSFEESVSDSQRATLLETLKAHGFNSIRLRSFVDPKAADGYDKTDGKADLAHTIAFGKQIKAAGLGFLLDLHYSDNWADPGKQCVPIAWQRYTTISDLAKAVHDYTKDALTQLSAAGARPDMVQIGNETTPGMLLHRCDGNGQPTGPNPITGSTADWPSLGALLKAGVQGVKEVDPSILVAFHIDRGGDKAGATPGAALAFSIDWLTNALKYTDVDAFGESCYQTYQGDANSTTNTKATWQSTLAGLANQFPRIKIFAAEYGPMQRAINDVVFNLPNQQGLGTFNWEPTTQGDWNTGHDLLRRSGDSYVAQPDLADYDEMKAAYASRL